MPRLAIDESLGETFEAMVREIAEYRLHRCLAAQAARRLGEIRRPTEHGVEVDATFSVETTGTTPTSVVVMAAGGTRGTKDARNTDYVLGLDLVLPRAGRNRRTARRRLRRHTTNRRTDRRGPATRSRRKSQLPGPARGRDRPGGNATIDAAIDGTGRPRPGHQGRRQPTKADSADHRRPSRVVS